MNFKRINNITGWIVCIIACSVYILTMEKSGSLWDCGEFVSSCYKLQIPHSPGAPLFVLVGRIFTIPFDPAHAASGVNLMSALASGFSILFLFWSITHLARKIINRNIEGKTSIQGSPVLKNGEYSNGTTFIIMAAGVVGALAYTFSDTFWYSAVEGEVYALSSFFTAIVFWAILKWEQAVDADLAAGIKGNFTPADRWILLTFLLIGLSIGVHILNLLTIPAVVMVYYFKKYKATMWGTIFAFVIGCTITGIVQKALIQWTIKGAGFFDILFVNSFHLPFFSGFAFFFLVLGLLIFLGIRTANKRNWNFMKLGLWSLAFMLLGYTPYFTTLVRSSANPAIDMGNVDNPLNLVSYLAREQYGDWPIVYGQDFTASHVAGEEYQPKTTMIDYYIKTSDGYEKKGKRQEITYNPSDMHLLPRMWDGSNDQGHADYYADWAGIEQEKDPKTGQPTGSWDRAPTMAENIGFFMDYQINWMYFRYFMWNFSGKQNDIQGIKTNNIRDGNWKTGIGFVDALRLGNQSAMPDSMKTNKSNNSMYGLPFILGMMGLIYHFKRSKKDTLVVALLFFFTGIAVSLYLNMAGNQPRERDYAFVGSFYAFAVWIGLGVLWVHELLASLTKNARTAGYIAAIVCTLAVPVLMGSVEWDDHDRSQKLLAPDLAKDYLESCDKNAILITYGDNDTYPLWYAQEVEGVRRDIRIINSSLLGTDWYINQLRYKINESDPIDPLWKEGQIEGSTRDVLYAPEMFFGSNAGQINQWRQKAGITNPAEPMDLYTMMKDYGGSDDPNKMISVPGTDDVYNVFPTKTVFIPVDVNLVKQNGTVSAKDSVVSRVQFTIPKNYLAKNDAAVLNIIAANKWKRPIYFTSLQAGLGFENYVRQDGLTYRLVPVMNDRVNRDWVVDKMMNNFRFANANVKGVYFDEENRRHLNSIRLAYASAAANLADNGRKEEAMRLLEKCDKGIPGLPTDNMPYGMVSRRQEQTYFSMEFLEAAYKSGDTVLAAKVSGVLKKDLEQQMKYYAEMGGMSLPELQKMIAASSQMRYQAQRDQLYADMPKRLIPLYEDAERGYSYLDGLTRLAAQYGSAKSTTPTDLVPQTSVPPVKTDSPKKN